MLIGLSSQSVATHVTSSLLLIDANSRSRRFVSGTLEDASMACPEILRPFHLETKQTGRAIAGIIDLELLLTA